MAGFHAVLSASLRERMSVQPNISTAVPLLLSAGRLRLLPFLNHTASGVQIIHIPLPGYRDNHPYDWFKQNGIRLRMASLKAIEPAILNAISKSLLRGTNRQIGN